MSIEIVDSVPGPGQRETTVFATAVPLVKTSNSTNNGISTMTFPITISAFVGGRSRVIAAGLLVGSEL